MAEMQLLSELVGNGCARGHSNLLCGNIDADSEAAWHFPRAALGTIAGGCRALTLEVQFTTACYGTACDRGTTIGGGL